MGVGCSWVKVLTAEYPEYESDDGCAGRWLWGKDCKVSTHSTDSTHR